MSTPPNQKKKKHQIKKKNTLTSNDSNSIASTRKNKPSKTPQHEPTLPQIKSRLQNRFKYRISDNSAKRERQVRPRVVAAAITSPCRRRRSPRAVCLRDFAVIISLLLC